MPTSASFESERSELKALLASGLFNRAPSLEHLLTYVCEKYFEGHGESVKEYNIAVEALGRPSDFDQKKDSIVRVEAFRLRRRLSEYYSGEGADHAIQILIPQGQYAPKFVYRRPIPPISMLPAPPEEAIDSSSTALAVQIATPLAPSALPVAAPGFKWQGWTLLLVALVATTVSAYSLYTAKNRKTIAVNKSEPPVVPHSSDEVRILAGRPDGNYVDSMGRTWIGDRYFHGGTVFNVASQRIIRALDPLIYQGRRQGAFNYDIPLKPGLYELRLHFAETLYGSMNLAGGGETSRIFQVWVNGKALLREFDVISDAGASTADVKVFRDVSPAADGELHLSFSDKPNEAFLNAIEISPGVPGNLKPIHIVARDRGYTDRQGRYWQPDQYSASGQLVVRTEEVVGAPDPELFRGERFGNLEYSIPVAPGRYTVTLRFAEEWFGPNKPAGGGAGSRQFDILCNGVALARNFDIYKEAGGSNRPLIRTFHNLEANHQGKLIISLVPIRNYACINALEIVDESK